VGKGGFEPPRLAALDPKSRLSANSSTSPRVACLPALFLYSNNIPFYCLALNRGRFESRFMPLNIVLAPYLKLKINLPSCLFAFICGACGSESAKIVLFSETDLLVSVFLLESDTNFVATNLCLPLTLSEHMFYNILYMLLSTLTIYVFLSPPLHWKKAGYKYFFVVNNLNMVGGQMLVIFWITSRLKLPPPAY
jgi:hypothetical protein